MKQVKILGLIEKGSGSRYHRVALPLSYLRGKEIEIKGEKAIIEVDILEHEPGKYELQEEVVKNYDIVWVNWIYSNPIAQISGWKSKYGFKLVQDVDDFWELPKNHIQSKTDYSSLIGLIVLADIVTVSTQRLAAHCVSFNKYVTISPNFLPLGENQFIPKKEESNGKISIGVCGGLAHYSDWQLLRTTVQKLANDSDIQKKCKFTIAGYQPNKKWDKIVSLFKVNPKMEVEVLEGKSTDSYMDLYDKIDILLAPLEKSEFAECKSSLKLIEAACKEIPVIGSSLYIDKEVSTILPAEKTSEYYGWVKSLVKDRSFKKVGKEASEVVKTNNHFEQRIDNLRLACEFLMNESTEVTPEDLKIYGITYTLDQSTEYTPIYNPIRTVEEKSYLFEYNPIINLIDNNDFKDNDYLGIFSWKFPYKTRLPKKLVTKIFNELKAEGIPDIIGLSPSFIKKHYLAFTEYSHPGFLSLFTKICHKLNLKLIEPKNIIYSNFWIGKYSIYKKYINEVIKPAIELLETEFKEEAFTNANYKAGLPTDALKLQTGLDYYTFHTFILERLLSIWLENNPEITFRQIN